MDGTGPQCRRRARISVIRLIRETSPLPVWIIKEERIAVETAGREQNPRIRFANRKRRKTILSGKRNYLLRPLPVSVAVLLDAAGTPRPVS